ncbi:acetyltransferase [Lutimaribacter pacificus]|uniref:Acetyltransferase n=1 Tax=Lutimaribacter pacificus TaxID=391948 RepID=A0A1H0M172_9RHOB|nr:acetate--CoA ligase family protein [Lutimaribacter pacificus]SDO74199.1 acetyltransferase [Lutimaribacter pacificus]SHK76522.1 acetyltransferase [Lutimaribacter pacificus]
MMTQYGSTAGGDTGTGSAGERTRRENLDRMFNPRSIAVVGASRDPAKAGSQALATLAGFPGTLVAVHPRETEIRGVPCYPGLADLPEPVDLAILAIPARACVQAAAEAAARGVGGVFIVSGGFGETGPEGARLEQDLVDICRHTGLRLLGPNTSGFVNPAAGCIASFVPGVDTLAPGRIAVLAQSGGVNLSLGYLLNGLGEGVSIAAGLGNAADTDTRDMLELLAEDDNTDAIALHLEGVNDGRALYETLCRVTPRKPVVAVVAGRADIGDFAVSHTGNLMGSRDRTVAALVQGGAVVVDTLDDLAQAAAVLARRRLPPKPRSAMTLITGQAGPGLLITDALKTAGIDLPELGGATLERIGGLLPPMTYIRNPIDTGRPGPGFPDIVHAAAQDAAIDAVLVFGISEPSVLDPAQALTPAHEATGKPVLFGTLGPDGDLEKARRDLRASGTPMVLGPDRLALAGIVLDADARHQWLLAQRGDAPETPDAPGGAALTGPIDESAAKALMRSYGIAVPRSMLCESRAAAQRAFADLDKPVVVKIAAADVAHKTELGGVVLDVRDAAQLDAALDRIARIPTAAPNRVLIEEMAPAGVDLILGGVRDPSWGPCVVIGLGGVLAEAVADSAVAIAPVGRADVAHMLDSLRGKRMLDGFRGLPRCDRAAIADAAAAIGRIMRDHPGISEVEINPLRVNEVGALALDALVVLGDDAGVQ